MPPPGIGSYLRAPSISLLRHKIRGNRLLTRAARNRPRVLTARYRKIEKSGTDTFFAPRNRLRIRNCPARKGLSVPDFSISFTASQRGVMWTISGLVFITLLWAAGPLRQAARWLYGQRQPPAGHTSISKIR